MDANKVYGYLVVSRGRLLDAIRKLTPEQYGRSFPIGLGSIASTLTHIMISEWYYVERLDGREVPPYSEWPIQYEHPPAFSVVEAEWQAQVARTRRSIEAQKDWNRDFTYRSFPDEAGKQYDIAASAGDMFTQLALHEVHHRAQIMVMMRQLGDSATPIEDIDYNALMFRRTAI